MPETLQVHLANPSQKINANSTTLGQVNINIVSPSERTITCSKVVIQLPYTEEDDPDALTNSNEFEVSSHTFDRSDPPFMDQNHIWLELFNDFETIAPQSSSTVQIYGIQILKNPPDVDHRDVNILISFFERNDSPEAFQTNQLKLSLINQNDTPFVNYFTSNIVSASKHQKLTLSWSVLNRGDMILQPVFLGDKDQRTTRSISTKSGSGIDLQVQSKLIDSEDPIELTQASGTMRVQLIRSTQFTLIADNTKAEGRAQLTLYLKDLMIIQFKKNLKTKRVPYGQALELSWIFSFSNPGNPNNRALLIYQEWDQANKIIGPSVIDANINPPKGTQFTKINALNPSENQGSILVYPIWNSHFILYLEETDSNSKTETIRIMAEINSPIGSIMMFAGSTIPNGWHVCDGSALEKASLEDDHFEALARALDQDPNADQLSLPNLTDRFAVGAGADAGLREEGGPDQHEHLVAEFTNQFETGKAGQHSHKYHKDWYQRLFLQKEKKGYNAIDTGSGNVKNQSTQDAGLHSHETEITIPEQRTSKSTDLNRPRYYGLHYIIRIK